MNQNRESDLNDRRRNSFGIVFPNHSSALGTKGDVETFFLILNDLINDRVIDDTYSTISRDLYRTLVNGENLERFKIESKKLREKFSEVGTKKIDWSRYPFNKEFGVFDYEQIAIDTNKLTLKDVFQNFFDKFDEAPFWVEKYLAKGMKNFPRIIVSPTEIFTDRKFRNFTDLDFKNSSEDPLWLREPG